jgi:hypothetical protein
MTPTATRLAAALLKAHDDLVTYQRKCKHVGHSRTYGSNDGNYDPSADRYWVDCCCSRCGHKWTEERDRNGRPV